MGVSPITRSTLPAYYFSFFEAIIIKIHINCKGDDRFEFHDG